MNSFYSRIVTNVTKKLRAYKKESHVNFCNKLYKILVIFLTFYLYLFKESKFLHFFALKLEWTTQKLFRPKPQPQESKEKETLVFFCRKLIEIRENRINFYETLKGENTVEGKRVNMLVLGS